jgi:hypothetical protein
LNSAVFRRTIRRVSPTTEHPQPDRKPASITAEIKLRPLVDVFALGGT